MQRNYICTPKFNAINFKLSLSALLILTYKKLINNYAKKPDVNQIQHSVCLFLHLIINFYCLIQKTVSKMLEFFDNPIQKTRHKKTFAPKRNFFPNLLFGLKLAVALVSSTKKGTSFFSVLIIQINISTENHQNLETVIKDRRARSSRPEFIRFDGRFFAFLKFQ